MNKQAAWARLVCCLSPTSPRAPDAARVACRRSAHFSLPLDSLGLSIASRRYLSSLSLGAVPGCGWDALALQHLLAAALVDGRPAWSRVGCAAIGCASTVRSTSTSLPITRTICRCTPHGSGALVRDHDPRHQFLAVPGYCVAAPELSLPLPFAQLAMCARQAYRRSRAGGGAGGGEAPRVESGGTTPMCHARDAAAVAGVAEHVLFLSTWPSRSPRELAYTLLTESRGVSPGCRFFMASYWASHLGGSWRFYTRGVGAHARRREPSRRTGERASPLVSRGWEPHRLCRHRLALRLCCALLSGRPAG